VVVPPRPNALNTGILCDGFRVIDVDVDNPKLAGEIKALAVSTFGETSIRTRGNSPRCALIYRAVEGQPPKISVTGKFGKVEILGAGNQIHVATAESAAAGVSPWLGVLDQGCC